MGLFGKILGGIGGFLVGGPAGAIAGASLGGAAEGAIRGKKQGRLIEAGGISRLSVPGLSLQDIQTQPSLGFTGFDPIQAQQGVIGQIAAGRSALGGISGNIAANRSSLSAIQSRSGQLLEDVRQFSGGFGAGGDQFGSIANRFGALSGQAAGVDTGRLGEVASDIAGLRGQLVPGFGALSQARQQAIRNQQAVSVGNLRESLSRRGVLGSSFAADALSRVELDFAQQEGLAGAEAFIQEAALTGDLARLESDILNSQISQSLAKLTLSGQLTEGQLQSVRDQVSTALSEATIKGQLFELEGGVLEQQARNVFISMGLNEQEAGLFSQELASLTSEATVVAQTFNQMLNALAVSGNIANGVSAIVADIAKNEALLQIEAAKSKGDAISGLGELFSGVSAGDVIGSIFGGGG